MLLWEFLQEKGDKMVELDVRGLYCPEPVLNLKPLLDKGENQIKVLCSCGASSDNIKRMAQSYHYEVKCLESNEQELVYELHKQN